jgi:16S rRNA (guanine966-N2)-methyltransferase
MKHPKRQSEPDRAIRDESLAGDRVEAVGLRIIGGRLRGRKLSYGGDMRVRPMKDRVREAVFSLLGGKLVGKQAVDLFAGTGALGLEALSRGAARATFIEQHYPTAAVLRTNIASLEVEPLCEVVSGNVFLRQLWQDRLKHDLPWIVFVSPPYAFFVDRTAEVLGLIEGLLNQAPPESVFVVESDERFDFQQLPLPEQWDVRAYPPAVVGLLRKAL